MRCENDYQVVKKSKSKLIICQENIIDNKAKKRRQNIAKDRRPQNDIKPENKNNEDDNSDAKKVKAR